MADQGNGPPTKRSPLEHEDQEDDNDASNANKRSPEALTASAKRTKHGHDEEGEHDDNQQANTDGKGGMGSNENDDEEESEEEESEEDDSEEVSSEEESGGDEEPEPETRAARVNQRRSFVVNLGPSRQPPARPPAPPPAPIEPTGNDVLFAPRHIEFRQCPGNQKLNYLIKKERGKYHASDHATRAMMIQGVVALLRQLEPPGRFLKYDQHTKKWIVASDEYAYMQVLQMFVRQHREDMRSRQAALYSGHAGGRDYSGEDESRYHNHLSRDSNGNRHYDERTSQDPPQGGNANEEDDRKPPARDPETDSDGANKDNPEASVEDIPALVDPPRHMVSHCIGGDTDDEDDCQFHTSRGLVITSLRAAVSSSSDSVEMVSEMAEHDRFARWARAKEVPHEGRSSSRNSRLFRGALQAQAVKPNFRAMAESLAFEDGESFQIFHQQGNAFGPNLQAAVADDDGLLSLESVRPHGMVVGPRSTAPLECEPPVATHLQSEPPSLVEPWDHPREYRRPDPTTWKEIKVQAEGAPPFGQNAFPYTPPQCGSRPPEVDKAAVEAILGRSSGWENEPVHNTMVGRSVTKVTTNDVLTGWNPTRFDHVGNLRCREAVRQSVNQYISARSINERNAIIEEIMAYVSEKGGRFLSMQLGRQELTNASSRAFIAQLMRAAVTELSEGEDEGPSLPLRNRNSAEDSGIARGDQLNRLTTASDAPDLVRMPQSVAFSWRKSQSKRPPTTTRTICRQVRTNDDVDAIEDMLQTESEDAVVKVAPLNYESTSGLICRAIAKLNTTAYEREESFTEVGKGENDEEQHGDASAYDAVKDENLQLVNGQTKSNSSSKNAVRSDASGIPHFDCVYRKAEEVADREHREKTMTVLEEVSAATESSCSNDEDSWNMVRSVPR